MPKNCICSVSGESFEISDKEVEIRDRLGLPSPSKKSKYIFQELLSFWQHFSLHKIKCGATNKSIISVYSEYCPYPVWHIDHWFKHANPIHADFDFSRSFFEQLWALFQRCPIPHNTGRGNENSEYTDDCWYSKNAYLSHSMLNGENISYSYRMVRSKDCQFCVFSSSCELCVDTIYSFGCYNITYGLHLRNCRDSYFLFDCRNCSDCILCWNLRNKKYCIRNKQYSKEEYFEEKRKFNISSRKAYNEIKNTFHNILKKQSWWRDSIIDKSENVVGNYVDNSKDSINCFLASDMENCVNFMRGNDRIKDIVDTVSTFESECLYYCSSAQDNCYNLKFCYNVSNCKNSEYLAFCTNCSDCFSCAGLVNKKYCILNKQYSGNEYGELVDRIKKHMGKTGEIGKFFPLHFAANSYDESLAGFYFPLNKKEQLDQGFRVNEYCDRKQDNYISSEEIPDNISDVNDDILKKNFWDNVEKKPLKITASDLSFCRGRNIPLNNKFYIRRIKENYAWIFFNGELRQTTCAKTGASISTTLPQEFDGRILCEKAYLENLE
jgi:hypothetical protein